ncbi:MAG: hypothetical protein RR447_10310, partial [Algoriella sp.]
TFNLLNVNHKKINIMGNLEQNNRSLYTYDGSAQNNKEEVQKLKQFSQSRVMIYGLVVLFFVFVSVRTFLKITSLEKLYPNAIPEEIMNASFNNQTAYDLYSSIGKWGFVGAFLLLSIIVFLFMINPHLKNIKEYNQFLKK